MMKAAFLTAGIGIVLTFVAGFLYLNDCDWATAVGAVSTGISLALGLVSIVYTYVSGQKTLKNLEEIRTQNKNLVAKINRELAKDNYDDGNIKAIRREIDKQRETEHKKC